MTPDELLTRAALPDSGPLVVALGGGADSAVAAWVATRLAAAPVRAVHIDHGTPAAPRLAAAAAALAEHLGLSLTVLRVEIEPGPSWEGRARTARWEAIEADRAAGEVVLTGHHADDLAETTLAHLLRGAGAAGLAAMAAPRNDVVRPLLGIARDAIVEVAIALGLPAADDPSNTDLTYTRNRVRHELIPQLELDYNPQLRPALVRAAHALAADDGFIEGSLGRVALHRDPWGAWKIPAPLIATAPEAVAARLVRRLLRAARPPHAGTADEVAAGLAVARGESRRRQIADGLHLELEGPWLVAHLGDAAAPEDSECPLPGTVRFGEFDVAAVAAPGYLVRRSSRVLADAIGTRVTLRAAQTGSRIEIATGSKPVRDVLAEAAVPRRLRSAWPLAVAHGRIAAVVGIRAAPWARGVAGAEGVFELTAGEGWL